MKDLRRDNSGIASIIIVLVVFLIIIAILLVIFIVPFKEVNVNETRQVAPQVGVDTLRLNFTSSFGLVNVTFVDGPDLITLDVTGKGRVGLLTPDQTPEITWQPATSGNVLTVTASANTNGTNLGIVPGLTYSFKIAKSLHTSLNITDSAGEIALNTVNGSMLDTVNLKTSAGAVRATLVEGVLMSGSINMEANAGGVDLVWSNVQLTKDIGVKLKTSTGGIMASVVQTTAMHGNVTFNGQASLGGIDMNMNLQGNNSATVSSQTNLGGMSVKDKTGFNGTNSVLVSTNSPDLWNFAVGLQTSAGGVSLNLRYAT